MNRSSRKKVWDENTERLFCACYVNLLSTRRDVNELKSEEKFSIIAKDMFEKSQTRFSHAQLKCKFNKLKSLYKVYTSPPDHMNWEKMERVDAKFRLIKNGEPPPNLDLLKIIIEAEKSIKEGQEAQEACMPKGILKHTSNVGSKKKAQIYSKLKAVRFDFKKNSVFLWEPIASDTPLSEKGLRRSSRIQKKLDGYKNKPKDNVGIPSNVEMTMASKTQQGKGISWGASAHQSPAAAASHRGRFHHIGPSRRRGCPTGNGSPPSSVLCTTPPATGAADGEEGTSSRDKGRDEAGPPWSAFWGGGCKREAVRGAKPHAQGRRCGVARSCRWAFYRVGASSPTTIGKDALSSGALAEGRVEQQELETRAPFVRAEAGRLDTEERPAAGKMFSENMRVPSGMHNPRDRSR